MSEAPAFAPNTEPIGSADEDALGRKSFAERICKALAAWDLKKGALVIGIDGHWGEGKSSLMTLMKANLEKSDYLYREFHPWLFSNEQAMTVEFFRVLHALLKKSRLDDLRKNALVKLKAYGPTLLTAVGVGGGAKALEKVLEGPSVLQQRDGLRDAMAKLDKPVVICVEDIDRLTPAEALRIATLIRLVGAFPNVIYLLPYDRKNFTRLLNIALTEKDSGPAESQAMGEGFCERLVQLDIRLPRATSAELMNLLDREIAKAVESAGIDVKGTGTVKSAQRFFEMCELSGLDALFRTPRDVTRFAGSLALVLSAAAGQVNLLDMLLLETLRLHVPSVYEKLRAEPQRYAGGGTLGQQLMRDLGERAERKKVLVAGLIGDLEDLKDPATRIVTELLPQLFEHESGTSERRRELRFGEPENIERYFRFGLTPADVNATELTKAVDAAVAGEPADLVALLSGDRADNVVLALRDVAEEADDEVRARLVSAVSAAAPQLKPTYAPFGSSAWQRLAILFGKLLLKTDAAKTLELVKTAPAEFIVYAVRLMDAEKDPRLDPAQGAMRETAGGRIVDALGQDAMWTSVAPLGMYIAILAAWQPEKVRDRVLALITGRPERARMLLEARIEPALMAGSVQMRGAQINTAQLNKEIDPKKLLEIVDADAQKNPQHVALLQKAIETAEGGPGPAAS